jgi:hypothetical protein
MKDVRDGKRGRRHKQLLDDTKGGKKGYGKVK